jgi:hypothetical protein
MKPCPYHSTFFLITRWCVLLLGLILGGCSASLEPIYTSGSYTRLPRDGTRVVLLTNETALTASVRQWLEDRHLEVIHAATTDCVRCEADALPANGPSFDDAVLVEASRASALHRMIVTVRGLSKTNARDLWSGTAWNHLPADIGGEEAERNAVTLSCHALGTIWRHRPGGLSLSPSLDLCHRHIE